MKYYIISVKHTRHEDKSITFWQSNNSGYTQTLDKAGIYSEEEINENFNYYNNEDNFAIPIEEVEIIPKSIHTNYLKKLLDNPKRLKSLYKLHE